LQVLLGWRDGPHVLARRLARSVRSAEENGRSSEAVLRGPHGGQGLERPHEYERLARDRDGLDARPQEFLGAGELSLLVRLLTEHAQRSTGAAAVAEPAQRGQALRHELGRAVMLAA